MVQPSRIRVSASDYFQLPDYENHDLIQLIDGEVVISIPPIPKHQALVGEVLFLFMTVARQVGGQAFTAPIEVYLDEDNVFEPDILYLRPDSACQVGEKRLIGAPDLVVEVLSPSTAKFDRQEKYEAYQKHGVGEYWIVDPVHEIIEVWTLNNGKFLRQGAYGIDDEFASRTLKLQVAVNSIFRKVNGTLE